MTDFRDILYFYPEKKTYFFNQGVSFLSLKKKYSLHTKMTSFFFLFFKVRDFAILDCCPDDKNHKVFSVPNLCIQTPFTFEKRKLAVTERIPDRLLSPCWSSFGTILL